jgi:hypothetical protein
MHHTDDHPVAASEVGANGHVHETSFGHHTAHGGTLVVTDLERGESARPQPTG